MAASTSPSRRRTGSRTSRPPRRTATASSSRSVSSSSSARSTTWLPRFRTRSSKETTLNQIGKGSRVEFEAAGACGLGGLSAAKQKHLWGIGVDADQSFLGPHILTSATKHVDLSVFEAIKAYKANPTGFKGAFNKNYTVKNHGVGYGKLSAKLSKADRTFITAKANHIAKLIAEGKIKIPSK